MTQQVDKNDVATKVEIYATIDEWTEVHTLLEQPIDAGHQLSEAQVITFGKAMEKQVEELLAQKRALVRMIAYEPADAQIMLKAATDIKTELNDTLHGIIDRAKASIQRVLPGAPTSLQQRYKDLQAKLASYEAQVKQTDELQEEELSDDDDDSDGDAASTTESRDE